jgi:Uncharacterised protein family (UPF0158)
MRVEDVEFLFNYVGSAPRFVHSAYLNLRTGEGHITSELGDFDELPDDFDESDDYLKIPHPSDLDLGRELVFEFVAQRLPDALEVVRDFFRRSGAYGRFRNLLEHNGLLDEWNDVQAERSHAAMLAWCAKNGIELQE